MFREFELSRKPLTAAKLRRFMLDKRSFRTNVPDLRYVDSQYAKLEAERQPKRASRVQTGRTKKNNSHGGFLGFFRIFTKKK